MSELNTNPADAIAAARALCICGHTSALHGPEGCQESRLVAGIRCPCKRTQVDIVRSYEALLAQRETAGIKYNSSSITPSTDFQWGSSAPGVPPYTKHNNRCLEKAEDDEPIFVLRGQDVSSPKHVLSWLADNIENVSEEKARDAFGHALAMRRYHTRKAAD